MKYDLKYKNIAAAAAILVVAATVVPPCGKSSAPLRGSHPPLPPIGGKAADTAAVEKLIFVNESPKKVAPRSGKVPASQPLPPDVVVLVERFYKVAVQEMDIYKVPASITLAQILLETNNGKSVLFLKANNLFGVKCFSKNCKAGHCMNKTDDSHKDFFIKYPAPWASIRAHSKHVTRGRYRHLIKLGHRNYKAWAHGLKKAGYATSKTYAQDLIALIEKYGLHKYDEL